MNNKFIVFWIALSLSFQSFGQEFNVQTFNRLIQENKDSYSLKLEDFRNFSMEEENELLTAIGNQLSRNENNKQTEFICIYYLNELGLATQSLPVRQGVVDLLLEGLQSTVLLNWQQSGRNLLRFTSNDFSENAKQKLKALSVDKNNQEYWHILLLGVAQVKDPKTLDWLRSIAEKSDYGFHSEGWAAKMVLSRLDLTDYTKECIAKIDAVSDILKKVTVIKHYGFMRNKETTEALFNYLNDKTTRIPSPKGYKEEALLANLAVEILSSIVLNFPTEKKHVGEVTNEDIQNIKSWHQSNPDYQLKK